MWLFRVHHAALVWDKDVGAHMFVEKISGHKSRRGESGQISGKASNMLMSWFLLSTPGSGLQGTIHLRIILAGTRGPGHWEPIPILRSSGRLRRHRLWDATGWAAKKSPGTGESLQEETRHSQVFRRELRASWAPSASTGTFRWTRRRVGRLSLAFEKIIEKWSRLRQFSEDIKIYELIKIIQPHNHIEETYHK